MTGDQFLAAWGLIAVLSTAAIIATAALLEKMHEK
jgi:hypothetical protein